VLKAAAGAPLLIAAETASAQAAYSAEMEKWGRVVREANIRRG